jgi:2-oxoglutarate ferredoxin oxidoreductase subunit delta
LFTGNRVGGSQLIEIDEELCKGCAICIEFCPLKVFEQSDKLNRKGYYIPVVVKEEECVGCRLCELLCPEFSIIVTNE